MPHPRIHALQADWHRHWQSQGAPWLAARRAALHRRFTEHPQATDETYLQHLGFTLRMGARLMMTGLIVLIHGLFPFLFTRTASRWMTELWAVMNRRGMAQPPDDPGSHI